MRPVILLVLACTFASGVALADDGWLGVQLQTLDPDLAKALELQVDEGVLVDEVVKTSPAEKAGLKHGDVIVAFQGSPIQEVKDLTKAVGKSSPGDEVEVTVLRDGKRQDLKVTLGEREDRNVFVLRHDGDDRAGKLFEMFAPPARGGYLGVGMQDLTEQLGKHFGVEGSKGVLVSEVKPDTPAARAGIEAGDVIVKTDDQAVASGSELRKVLASLEPDDEVALTVIRGGRSQILTAKLSTWPEGSGAQVYLDHARGGFPRMHEFVPSERRRELHVMRPDGDVENLREEVEQLRKDLDELRQELKNR